MRELVYDVDPEKDKVMVDLRVVVLPGRNVYLMLNKPVGYATMVRDCHADKTVMSLVPNLYPSSSRLKINKLTYR